MKKGQSGVSLIALVITIIVVIILAAVAFGTSTRTITNANWSTFTNALGEVRTALQERVTTVRGQEAQQGTQRTEAQVYNYVAKGASGENQWLSRDVADSLSATEINKTVIQGDLGLKNLNEIRVNTSRASRVEVTYFVTKTGEVFIWPPYEYEGEFYVNEKTKLSDYGYTDATATTANKATSSTKTYEYKSIKFSDGVLVPIANAANPTNTINGHMSGSVEADLSGVETVYYADKANPTVAMGLEHIGGTNSALYDNSAFTSGT